MKCCSKVNVSKCVLFYCSIYFIAHETTSLINFLLTYYCCRLLDVVSAQRTHHDLQLMLIFEHVDQDLAQYLEKNPSGLGPENIQARSNLYYWSFSAKERKGRVLI